MRNSEGAISFVLFAGNGVIAPTRTRERAHSLRSITGRSATGFIELRQAGGRTHSFRHVNGMPKVGQSWQSSKDIGRDPWISATVVDEHIGRHARP